MPRPEPKAARSAGKQVVSGGLRPVPGLKKKPSTSKLLDWLKLLLNGDITPESSKERDRHKLIPPLHGALLKNEQDVHLLESKRGLRRYKLAR